MQYFSLLFWLSVTVFLAKAKRFTVAKLLLCALLPASMLTQLLVLSRDGILSVETAVPLHICSLSGVLAVPMLAFSSRRLYEAFALLCAPCALLALLFPAVMPTSSPITMSLAFYRLHSLIICATALMRMERRFPPPADPRPVMLMANVYLLAAVLFNAAFNTNYLFLRRAPAGTPLEMIARNGAGAYILCLEMAAMPLMSALTGLYARVGDRLGKIPARRGPLSPDRL